MPSSQNAKAIHAGSRDAPARIAIGVVLALIPAHRFRRSIDDNEQGDIT
jgi:hypothetical protein